MNNKFKIVVPSYNNEKWIATNIESIKEQNYANFEVLYINDKSWWFYRDEYTFLLSSIKQHNPRKLHLITIGNICERVIAQIDNSSKKHILKEIKDLNRIVDNFRNKEFASLSSYIKSKYFKF